VTDNYHFFRSKNDFHDHLDQCSQCSNNPFELCATGAHLIQSSMSEAPLPNDFGCKIELNRDYGKFGKPK
jgi:hypothetical protein